MQRCLLLFEHSIKSEKTLEVYNYLLEKFRKFAKVQHYEDLLQADEKSIQRLVEDYVMHLKTSKISPNSFSTQVAPVILFFQVNDVNLNIIKLRKMYPERVKRSGYGAYTRDDIRKMLNSTTKIRTKAIILFLASTGCRASGLIDLKMRDLDEMPNGCRSVLFYAGSTQEYYGFLTPEASQALDYYIEKRIEDGEQITDDSPVIRESYDVGSEPARHMTLQMMGAIIETSLKHFKRTRAPNGRYTIQTAHGFRKYFNLVLKSRKDANLSKCEKLLGHSVTIPLDNHYAPFDKDQLFEEFCNAIPELSISDYEKQKVEINKIKQDKQELESQKDLIIQQLRNEIQSRKNTEYNVERILQHLHLND